MTDPKAQLVTLRAFLMLAVITVAIATFTARVTVWPGPDALLTVRQSGSGSISLLWSFGSGGSHCTCKMFCGSQ
jgi:hypothetical protein